VLKKRLSGDGLNTRDRLRRWGNSGIGRRLNTGSWRSNWRSRGSNWRRRSAIPFRSAQSIDTLSIWKGFAGLSV